MTANILPVNEHGNIEVWGGEEKWVPAGAALVSVPFALQCAKKLNLQYAQVVIFLLISDALFYVNSSRRCSALKCEV